MGDVLFSYKVCRSALCQSQSRLKPTKLLPQLCMLFRMRDCPSCIAVPLKNSGAIMRINKFKTRAAIFFFFSKDTCFNRLMSARCELSFTDTNALSLVLKLARCTSLWAAPVYNMLRDNALIQEHLDKQLSRKCNTKMQTYKQIIEVHDDFRIMREWQ